MKAPALHGFIGGLAHATWQLHVHLACGVLAGSLKSLHSLPHFVTLSLTCKTVFRSTPTCRQVLSCALRLTSSCTYIYADTYI